MTAPVRDVAVPPDGPRRDPVSAPDAPSGGRMPTSALVAVGAVLTAACFTQSPGRVVADTKLDLFVNPAGLLHRALHLWDATAGFGQLQNQVQGYLLPMGPVFALGHALGVPVWWLQRVWAGALLGVACAGVVRLAEELEIGSRASRLAAGLAYALSPLVLTLLGPLSALVLPAAFTPWAVIPLVRGSRGGSPARAAARSGVAVALMGAVNAGATAAAVLLPAIWLATRRRGARRRALAAWWALALALACGWWAVSLLVEGGYVFDFLRHIERASTTTATTSMPAVLRGTANWIAHYVFQGQPWWRGAWVLVAAPAAILATSVLAAAGLAGLAGRRLPERRFLGLSLLVGVALSTAGYGGALGSPVSGLAQHLLDGPLVVFRSINKFQPLVTLPLALGLAHVVGAVRVTRAERAPAVAVTVLLVAGAALPFLQGDVMPAGSFTGLPAYWSQTADWLAARGSGGRALLLPASGFGEYQWGRPVDEPLQALARSPWAVRGQAPLGSPGVVRLLDAIEDRLVSGRPSSGLAPTLARAGVRYLVVRNDLDSRRANAPSPTDVRSFLASMPDLRPVAAFGPRVGTATGIGADPTSSLHAVDIYEVGGDVATVTTYPADGAVVLSGGPEGLLQLADRGRLSGAVVAAGDPSGGLGDLRWAVTDGLRRRDVNVGLVHGGTSYVLAPGERVAGGGQPRDWLPVDGTFHQTVAAMDGAVAVRASSYASAVAPVPAAQPMAAFDGDPATAWRSGAVGSSVGEWVEADLARPLSLDSVTVRLLVDAAGPRPTVLRVATDTGGVDVPVTATEDPQVLRLPPGATRRVRVTIAAVVGEAAGSLARAGLREVDLPGVDIRRLLAVPADEVGRFSGPGAPPPLFAFDRVAGDPAQLRRPDEEDRMARRFTVPRAAAYDLSGTVRPRPGPALDGLLAAAGPAGQVALACGQGPAVRVDGRLVPTTVSASADDLHQLREVPFSACGAAVDLAAGTHDLDTDAGAPLAVTAATLAGQGWGAPAAGAPGGPFSRPVTPRRWASNDRRVDVAPGPRAVLAVAENFNRGWTARLHGRPLRSVRLDGWRQGWVVPAGAGGSVELTFAPDRAYRAALGLGAVALAALAVLALGAGRRRRAAPPKGDARGAVAPGAPPPAALPPAEGGALVAVTLAVVVAALVLAGGVAGFVALVAVMAAAAALSRRRPQVRRFLPAVAAGAFLVAGAVEALQPSRSPGSGAGAFGWPAQLAALVAVAAVGAALLSGFPTPAGAHWPTRWRPGRDAGPPGDREAGPPSGRRGRRPPRDGRRQSRGRRGPGEGQGP